MGYNVVDLYARPSGLGGAVRLVRRELGASAFGINHFTLQPGAFGREHDEAESGQEEVMFIVSGSGTLHVGGEDVELRPGRSCVSIPRRPESPRQARTGSCS